MGGTATSAGVGDNVVRDGLPHVITAASVVTSTRGGKLENGLRGSVENL